MAVPHDISAYPEGVGFTPCWLRVRWPGQASFATYQANDNQKHHGADGCGNQTACPGATGRNAENSEKPAPQYGANDADNDVPHDAQPASLEDQPGQPSGNTPNQQEYNKLFCAHSLVWSFLPLRAHESPLRGRAQI